VITTNQSITHHNTIQNVGAIILAAGISNRMQGKDKMWIDLLGQPLITYSLNAFNNCKKITQIVLVVSESNIALGQNLVVENKSHKVSYVCEGGKRRQDSVRLGLERIASESDWIIVHDGARPCIDNEIIDRALNSATTNVASTAAVPVKDTIKVAENNLIVKKTLPRKQLWSVQTPQIFKQEILYQAHLNHNRNVTDDAAMVENSGNPVKIFLGSYNNIKVTTPEDIPLAETILKNILKV